MDSLFKEEMFENIKMGRYFQVFEINKIIRSGIINDQL